MKQADSSSGEKLHIVHLLNEFAQLGNGIVNVAIDLAVEHARAGHHVTVAAPDGAYAALLRANGVQHFPLEPSGGVRPAHGNVQAARVHQAQRCADRARAHDEGCGDRAARVRRDEGAPRHHRAQFLAASRRADAARPSRHCGERCRAPTT